LGGSDLAFEVVKIAHILLLTFIVMILRFAASTQQSSNSSDTWRNKMASLPFVRLLPDRCCPTHTRIYKMRSGDFSRSLKGCTSVLATIVALVLSFAEPPFAAAGPIDPISDGTSATPASSSATDFSAARRHRHYRRGGNAAGLAFMGLAIGAIGAIAAQQRRNDYYDNGYGYAPGYYGGGPYYGRSYYR
jgi:hypothetical protein